MSPEQRIEEAHGLWELAIARVAALTEAAIATGFQPVMIVPLADATRLERDAFANWQKVSRECGA